MHTRNLIKKKYTVNQKNWLFLSADNLAMVSGKLGQQII